MGERAIARPQAARGSKCCKLVPAEVHVRLDRAVQFAPGRVYVRAKREPPGEVREEPENLPVVFIHGCDGTRCPVVRDRLDVGHATSRRVAAEYCGSRASSYTTRCACTSRQARHYRFPCKARVPTQAGVRT